VVLFDQICGPGVEPGRFRPYLTGSNNFYPGDTLLLRITQAGNMTGNASGNMMATQRYSLRDRHLAREEKWYDELPSANMLRWHKLPAATARVEDHSKADYALELLDGQPAQAGFDPATLPDLSGE
jgi:hypothetical protein